MTFTRFVFVMLLLCATVHAQTITPERKAYNDAVSEYNAFMGYHETMKQLEAKYGSMDGDRQEAACFLSAQVIVAVIKDPALSAENGESKEWRHWIDVQHDVLKCQEIKP